MQKNDKSVYITSYYIVVAAVVAACFWVAISIFIVAQLIKRRRMSRWIDTLSEAEVNLIAKKQESKLIV
jgi:threonine/homoserine/homoserine lactone efflux protein